MCQICICDMQIQQCPLIRPSHLILPILGDIYGFRLKVSHLEPNAYRPPVFLLDRPHFQDSECMA